LSLILLLKFWITPNILFNLHKRYVGDHPTTNLGVAFIGILSAYIAAIDTYNLLTPEKLI